MKKKVLMLLLAVFSVIGMSSITVHADDVQPVEVNQEIELTGSYKWYSFKIEQQGKISIKVISCNHSWSYSDCSVELYKTDEDGNDVYVDELQRIDDEVVARFPKGEYKLKFYAGLGKTYIVKTKIVYEPENPDYFETEENGSFKTANNMVLNREYTGNIVTGSDDRDYYKIELEQPGSLMLNFRVGSVPYSTTWKISLYSEDEDYNKNLIKMEYNDVKKNTKLTKYRLPKGIYYVCIQRGSYYSNEDYKIGTTYVDESLQNTEKEYNDTIDTANEINTNI